MPQLDILILCDQAFLTILFYFFFYYLGLKITIICSFGKFLLRSFVIHRLVAVQQIKLYLTNLWVGIKFSFFFKLKQNI
jgi:hypothetical protein